MLLNIFVLLMCIALPLFGYYIKKDSTYMYNLLSFGCFILFLICDLYSIRSAIIEHQFGLLEDIEVLIGSLPLAMFFIILVPNIITFIKQYKRNKVTVK